MKEKLFKFLFPKKVYEIENLKRIIEKNMSSTIKTIEEYRKAFAAKPKEFGFDFDFNGVNEMGEPKHYLADLDEKERINYLAHLEAIYTDDYFNQVIKYCINLHGNKGIHVLPEADMPKARYAILGIKKLFSEFEKAHIEFVKLRKGEEEEFDPLDPLPTN